MTGDTFHVNAAHQPLMRMIGLDAEAVFARDEVVAWRKLPDRENCTLDADLPDGRHVRLHIKRYTVASAASRRAAEREVEGYRLLREREIPSAELVGWGHLADGRSFVITEELYGCKPADKLVEGGVVPFATLLEPTADLAARLHDAGLHHRDLYLCHFMAPSDPAGSGRAIKLIDVARVRPLPGWLTRRRWVVKDLAQFWYSTLALPAAVTDAQRDDWLARYASRRAIGNVPSLRRSIVRKVGAIARHDAKLRQVQPSRNISIAH